MRAGRRLLRFGVQKGLVVVAALGLAILMGQLPTGLVFDRTLSYATWGATPGFSVAQYGGAVLGYLSQLARGSLGLTRYHEPVAERLAVFCARSGLLVIPALILALLGGVWLGIQSSRRLRTRLGGVSFGAVVALSAIPDFLVVMGIQVLGCIAVYHGATWLRVAGMGDWRHFVLPVVALTTFPMAYVARLTTVAMDRVLGEDYIRTARSKGCPAPRVTYGHALKNVAVELAGSVASLWLSTLSCLVLVEYFFFWPGAGLNLLGASAVHQRNYMWWPGTLDPSLLTGLALAFAASYLIVDVLAGAVRLAIDPRLRRRGWEV